MNKNQKILLATAGILVVGGGIAYANRASITEAVTDEVTEVVSNNLGFEIDKVGFKPSFPIVILPVDFTITNDNILGADNVTFQGAIYYEGVKFGIILESDPFNVPASNTVRGEVEVLVDTRDLKEDLLKVISTFSFSENAVIKGTVNSSLGSLAVTRSVPIKFS